MRGFTRCCASAAADLHGIAYHRHSIFCGWGVCILHGQELESLSSARFGPAGCLRWQGATLPRSRRAASAAAAGHRARAVRRRARRRPPRLHRPAAHRRAAARTACSSQQVEDAYSQRPGRLPQRQTADAKMEFDRAVDLMLASGIDIHGNPQLAGRVRPHRGRRERAGDGGAEAGQRLCAPGRAPPADVASDVHLRRWTPTLWPRPRPTWPPPSPICRWL